MLRRQLTISVLACTVLLGALPVHAQYYGGPYNNPQAYDDDDDDDRPPPRRHYRRDYGYERPYYRQPRYGDICVTGRGDCPTPPLPYGSNCGCNIPGFGSKRGIVQ
ncbi:MAG: hypothetical protein J0I42_20990 [Bosea sp.]|uniref:hypothetical protein n=1 Tax=Bosea sp. (in: a-proteobacteria) TaxID=1871050 RepID=UPI001ACFE705|nr:hypothetical protein [Bosea sp. (in: a-proteobacteria)]MBN9454421.1 hypothetical protein [Bosea sp. (in: a-proteobacteria)]